MISDTALTSLILHGSGTNIVVTPLAITATVLLIVFMGLREVTSSLEGPGWRAFGRYLIVAIVPLVLAFGVIVAELLLAFVRNPPPLH